MPTPKTRRPWRASAPTLATMGLGVGAGRVVVDGAAAVTLRNASRPQPGAPLRTPRPGGTARPGEPGREPSGGSAGCCVDDGDASGAGYAACSRPYVKRHRRGTGRTPLVEEPARCSAGCPVGWVGAAAPAGLAAPAAFAGPAGIGPMPAAPVAEPSAAVTFATIALEVTPLAVARDASAVALAAALKW